MPKTTEAKWKAAFQRFERRFGLLVRGVGLNRTSLSTPASSAGSSTLVRCPTPTRLGEL
jgi:hypothetical protein